MEVLNCPNCSKEIISSDTFCGSCGIQIKCSNCDTPSHRNSNFCHKCGQQLGFPSAQSNLTLNTIKYRKTNEETSYDIAFSDAIGKEGINELLMAVLQNRSIQNNPATTNLPSEVEVTYLPKINHSQIPSEPNIHISGAEELETPISDMPHLNDLENSVDCSENVWISIHAFYLSKFGSKNFTKEAVRTSYMNRRRTASRAKKFAEEWKNAHKKYFRTINDNELAFEHKKVEELKQLILNGGKSSASKSIKTSNSKTSKKTPARSITIQDFDLHGNTNEKIPSLEELNNSKKPENTNERILIIAYYITKILKKEIFTEGQIEFAYKALQLPDRPSHLRQTVNNVKTSKVWFKDVEPGQWSLERLGEIYVENKLPSNNN